MMRAPWRRRALAALLAAGVALAGPPGVGWPAVPPDLKLEFVGFPTPNDDRGIQFRVTNVGQGPASKGKAHVQTLGVPEPNAAEPDYPALAPGQSATFEYRLAAGCGGGVVTVKAGVSATADGETNYSNNFFEDNVCPAQAQSAPQPEGTPSGPDALRALRNAGVRIEPEWARRGPGTRELDKPSAFHPHAIRRTNEGALGCLPEPGAGLMQVGNAHVGYRFFDGLGCDVNYVWQLVVNFDLEWLRGIEKKFLTRAELHVSEEVHGATNNDGDAIPVGTCIGRLGLAPPNWPEIVARRDDPNSLKPTLLATEPAGDRLPDGPGQNRGWIVTNELQHPSNGTYPPLAGFVLHGPNENLGAESEASCGSSIHKVWLKLEYTVLE
jgi:hypothetical protein